MRNTTPSCPAAQRRSGVVARRMLALALIVCALPGFAAPMDSKILFARDSRIPRAVQQFAWRAIVTNCAYQQFEREQRSFWAFQTQASRVGDGVVYSINILSDLPWKKTEPPAVIEMTVVDDGGVRLTALRSTFVACALSRR